MAEWSKAPAWKAGTLGNRCRGFKSLSLRHFSWFQPKYSTSAFYFAIIDLAVLDGEVAVPCNLQPALARWNSRGRASLVKLSLVGSDEIWVLRNRTLRTVSDLDGSSTKESVLCAVRSPESSSPTKVTFGGDGSIKGVRLFIY